MEVQSSNWHIGLNAHLLSGRSSYRSAGIHQYLQNLLANLPGSDADMRFTAFIGPDAPAPILAFQRSRLPTANPLVRIVWEQMALPLLAAQAGIDLLHSTAFVAPLAHPGPHVVTVYDLSFDLTPERFSPFQRAYLSTFTAISCRRARRILAISENTRADIVRAYGIPPEKVDVAYPGVGSQFTPRPAAEVEEFRLRRALPERFVLFLGTIEPRKNLDLLLRAFARLQSTEVKLVLAGGRGWMYEEIFKLIEYLQLNNSVILPGYVAGEDLPLLYGAASVFAYPSVYEGFGLPPAEAMACGVPVVVTASSSLPEVVGEAGLCVPAGDVDALADALHLALTDSGVAERLHSDGPARARRFTWEAAARATVDCYRRALGAALPEEALAG